MADALLSSYEAVPYESNPMYLTHPGNLATVAALHGLSPPPLTGARVLELGCASGGNLIPMALGLPQATFVGVDLSGRQIAAAQDLAGRLGLGNLTLVAQDLGQLPADLGAFDYIIAHGLYSWVGDEARGALMRLCGKHLAERGVAYISYNTYPGCHSRDVVRDLMLYHTRRFADPRMRARQARGVLDFFARSVPEPEDAYRRLLQLEARILSRRSDEYLLHDHLEVESHPVYFHQFVEHAAGHGLQYLAEAEFSLIEGLLPAEVRRVLDQISDDLIELEQYRDFLFNRRFRQTLLCRAGAALRFSPVPEVLSAMHVRGLAEPVGRSGAGGDAGDGAEEFRKQDGVSLTSDNPVVKAVLRAAWAASPRALPFGALLDAASAFVPAGDEDPDEVLAGCLAECHMARLVELNLWEPAFATEAGERPRGAPLAVLQAAAGAGRVTNLRHRMVELEEIDRAILGLLDGNRDRGQVLAALVEKARSGAVQVQVQGQKLSDEAELASVLAPVVEGGLRRLGSAALLLG